MSDRIIICASGELGFTTLLQLNSSLNIIGVLTDSSSHKIIDWAQSKNRPIYVGNPRKNSFDGGAHLFKDVDILLSINYLFLIDKKLIQLPKKVSLNIHGALLPKYRGRAPHIWAIINGEKKCGITVHRIDEGCDTGDIVLQEEIQITDQTTGGELLKKFAISYPALLLKSLQLIKDPAFSYRKQDEEFATYFGKRTPEDGELSWSWDSVRIKNWVRALTAPYPGAFSYYKNEKVYIWTIAVENNLPVLQSDANGKIVKFDGMFLYIKAANAILKIEHFTKSSKSDFKVGEILGQYKTSNDIQS